jgi:hypothetical protein
LKNCEKIFIFNQNVFENKVFKQNSEIFLEKSFIYGLNYTFYQADFTHIIEIE